LIRIQAATVMSRPSPQAEAFAAGDRVVPVLLERQAARYGDRPLLVVGTTRWTYADSVGMAAGFGAALQQSGVRQGDRVALLCSNRAEFIQTFLGCAWIGAIAVPINVASRGEQLRHVLANSGARLWVVESDLLAAVHAIDATGLAVETIWLVGEKPSGGERVATLPFPPAGEPVARAPLRPGDTLAILYTSGTTGPSKGVCCPHAQYFWWGVHSSELLEVAEGETLLTTLPLFHTNALNAFFQALLTGSTLVVEKRFSASGFWDALARSGATVTYLLGAMVPILLSKDPTPRDRAHRVRLALAPGVPAQFHTAFHDRFGMRLLEGYGSTETNFVIGANLAEQRPGTMGKVRPGFEARVVDDQDNELGPGAAGELILRADQPFAFSTGYFGMSERTVEAWRNLWFHTGDRVVRDADGYFRFVDRLKDAIRRRGENISSYEVEQVLLSHPLVATAAVYPVSSALAEDEVMAAIVVRPGAAVLAVDVMRFCETRMAYFAVPRYVEFVDQLPVTENGKVQKFRLRERGVTAATWDREAAGYKLAR
jgi:crotonobetaine/carnitine-CoA ligase